MHIGDTKLLAKAMRAYPRENDLNTRNYALEGSNVFESINRNMDLPLRFKYDYHPLDKVNYSIPHPKQNPLRHALRSSSHVMRMWCLTTPMCWNQSVWKTNGTFLDCLIHRRKCAMHCRATHSIHARPKWGRVNMAHPSQLVEA